MTPLVLIRHGPTVWNAAHRLQGHTDVPLSIAGRAEIRWWRIPDEFLGYHPISSPLVRATETAFLLTGRMPPTDARLIEMGFGEWEGRVLAELRGELGDEMAELEARGLDFQAPGGESPRQVQDRIKPFLAEVGTSGLPTIAFVHKGLIRAVYAAAANWDMVGRPPEKLKDGCAQVFAVDADGMPHVHRLNVNMEAS